MERLTRKLTSEEIENINLVLREDTNCRYTSKPVNDCMDEVQLTNMYNKLGELEDIEEELGIDLVTLFIALYEGIYTMNYITKEIEHISVKGINRKKFILNVTLSNDFDDSVYINDYGKTWALTREELDNGK